MAYVHIDLEDINDHELIDELKERGYKVIDPDEVEDLNLSPYEAETLLSMITISNYKTGSEEHHVIQKLWDIYYSRKTV
jgi:hypothetical protein